MPISPGGTKYDDDELDALFKAVGFIVVQWGQSEQALEIIVAVLYQNLGGNDLPRDIWTIHKWRTAPWVVES